MNTESNLIFNRNVDSLFKDTSFDGSLSSKRNLNLSIKKIITNNHNFGSEKMKNFNYFNICSNFKKEMEMFDQKQLNMKKSVILFNDENKRFNSVYRTKSFLSGSINLKQMPKSSVKLVNRFINKFEDKDYNLFEKSSLLLNTQEDINKFYKYNFKIKEKNDEGITYSKNLHTIVNEDSPLKNVEKILKGDGNSKKKGFLSKIKMKIDNSFLNDEENEYQSLPVITISNNIGSNSNEVTNRSNIMREKEKIKKLNNLCTHIEEDIEYFKTIDYGERRKKLLENMNNTKSYEIDIFEQFRINSKSLSLKDRLRQNTLIFEKDDSNINNSNSKDKKRHKIIRQSLYPSYLSKLNIINKNENENKKGNNLKYFLTGNIKESKNNEKKNKKEFKLRNKFLEKIRKIREPNQVKSIYEDIFNIKATSNKFINKHEKGFKFVYSTTSDKYEKVFGGADIKNHRLNKLDKELMTSLHNFDD